MTNPRDDLMALVDRLDEVAAYEPCCPFCGRDPFHRIDNGLGMEAVAVTCCNLGDLFYRGARPAPDEVTMSWDDFQNIGDRLSLLRPAEPIENVQSDIVAQRTWFEGENVRTENLTADDIYQKPDATSDAVGEPVAWIITWSDGETSFTRSAPSASSPKNCKYQPLYTHPQKSPDTSAAVLQEALLDATASLVAAASAYRKYASRHRRVGRAAADPFFCTRVHDFEKAAESAQAAIRHLPAGTERGGES